MALVEQRRYRYNRDLLLVGIVSWLLVLIAGSAAVKPGEDFEEPIMMIIGPSALRGLCQSCLFSGAATGHGIISRRPT